MKYRLLKDIKGVKAGKEFDLRDKLNVQYGILHLIEALGVDNKERFEEIKEEPKKPKWRVGDYVTYDNKRFKIYMKVTQVRSDDTGYFYNDRYDKYLRNPTQEELDLYFR